METPPGVNELLKTRYDLHKAPEVTTAAQRHHARTGECISQDPRDRVQNYINRFYEIFDREDSDKREHGIDAIKRLLYRNYVIKADDIPESYLETLAWNKLPALPVLPGSLNWVAMGTGRGCDQVGAFRAGDGT